MDMGSFPKMLHFKQNLVPNPQLLRWSAWFSQYSFDVKNIKGKKNIVADFFSRKEPLPQQALVIPVPPCFMFSPVTSEPPDIHQIPYPWEKEDIERIRNQYEFEIFSSYGGSILNPFGTNPEYPFCQIFIARHDDFPKSLLWYFWCLCHQYHILMEFQSPFFNQPLNPNLQVFLQWFRPLTYWSGLFSTQSKYVIFHFHRPCNLQNNQVQSCPSAVIYKEMDHTILDLDDEYEEAQRYIFQENRCIPPEIWPGHYGSWNYHSSHPHWTRIKRAKKEYQDKMNDTVMQDSQDPYHNTGSSQDFPSSSTISSYKFKNRTEWKSIENRRRNAQAHQHHIEMLNITDPATTPSDTPDDDYQWAWNDVDMEESP